MRVKSNLKKLLEQKSLSMYKLSQLSNISKQTINEYHKDRLTKYDGKIVAKLCKALNCKIEELLEVVENEEENF